ncbi:MAG: tRNA (guanosine(18)-2'-O)-methyltransferase TrmH [Longimicrobiales bacterium]|nr:tRNA (guanosine(18)-2'-O)-methyltransferase TrmH [Longimicrobiales bacterium]
MTPERFRKLREVLLRRQPDLTLLMERVNKPHNFSAILRSCDAAGVFRAHVVLPERGIGVHAGIAAGATRWVPVTEHDSTDAAFRALRSEGVRLLAAHPGPAARDYREIDYTEPTCLVMGAELHGVSDTALESVDAQVVIPMEGFVHSLNVSVAAAILLAEAREQRARVGMYDASRLDPETFDRTLFEWAYPKAARRFTREGRDYPTLDDDGCWVRGN